ncbi:N-acetyltransferase 6-like [Scleropages formosus]|uniref:N-acetyltransferase 6-like n=1 Tax=Scleropages formosus TaxID=113540 RepID=A0A0P7VQ32_SCLFO|nr:N-acetyltransferase 6-like [Scleropages formosus]
MGQAVNRCNSIWGTEHVLYLAVRLGHRSDGEVRAVPLHHRLDLLEACAELVNTEWPRSLGARVHALQKSCHNFPVCLVLLQGAADEEQLLGHARLSRVVGQSRSLFVESVVVSQKQRGKGYGRALMEATECYAKARGFRRLCLTTHDKQHFYSHLGYVLSSPVQNAGAMTSFMPMEILEKFSRMRETGNPAIPSSSLRPASQDGMLSTSATVAPQVVPPAAFCLPLPLSSQTCNTPLAPPPPPLLSTSRVTPKPPSGQATGQTLLETPYKDAKGLPIFWMHKDL